MAWFLNFYRCARCKRVWLDQWSCTCDDDCPHCGAYTTQTWYNIFAASRPTEHRTPFVADKELLETVRAAGHIPEEEKSHHIKRLEQQLNGLVGVYGEADNNYSISVFNLHLSQCFNCGKFAVWIYDRLVFPAGAEGPPPNEDLPESVRGDYEEASKILNLSPRGSAALLRLAIQKLCIELGEKGKIIDDDIASLVKKGLSPLV